MLTLSSFKASCVINYCSSCREIILLAIHAIYILWLKLHDLSELNAQPKMSSLTSTLKYVKGCWQTKEFSMQKKAPQSHIQIAEMSLMRRMGFPYHLVCLISCSKVVYSFGWPLFMSGKTQSKWLQISITRLSIILPCHIFRPLNLTINNCAFILT